METTETAPPVREKSVREVRWEKQRKRNDPRQPKPQMTEKNRAHNLSEANIAMLRENVRKYREANGGKAATAKGVPKGWGGKKNRKRHAQIVAQSQQSAERIMEKLVENGIVQKDGAGNSVLAWAVGVVLAKDPETEKSAYPIREQLQAAKMVLEYTMQKPVTKAEVTHTAESFLTGLLTENVEDPS